MLSYQMLQNFIQSRFPFQLHSEVSGKIIATDF